MSLETYTYLNGNYVVKWSDNGLDIKKRCLRAGEDLKAAFPDSIDLKITNKCSWGCPYCHESSTKVGESFNLEETKKILSQLPELPIEIAIGGGDVLDVPEVKELIKYLNIRGNKTRATINIKDILKRRKEVDDLLGAAGAIGVSMDKLPENIKVDWKGEKSLQCTLDGDDDPWTVRKPYVIHIIAGVFPYTELEELFNCCDYPILILGYKQWGRAKDTPLPKDILKFKEATHKIILDRMRMNYARFVSGKTIGFDNLALEQLDIKSILSEDEWNRIYLGDEGTHSMYVDAVKGEFAMTSRSAERVSWNSIGLIDYFKNISHD